MPKDTSERRAVLREKYHQEIQNLKHSHLQVITMQVGSQVFAIDIMQTREIISTPAISPLPFTEDYVLGIFQFRGKTVLAVDLGKKVGMDQINSEDVSFTVIVESEGYQLGFVLGQMPATAKLDGDSIQEIGDILTDTTRQETYIKGIVRSGESSVYWMDVEEFVADNKVKLDKVGS